MIRGWCAPSPERGFALPLVVVTLFVIGALVSIAFAVAWVEQRIARDFIGLQQALGAAEVGLHVPIAGVAARAAERLSVGEVSTVEGEAGPGGGWFRTNIERLSNAFFLVTADGADPARRVTQRLGLFVRLAPLEFETDAALTARGPLEIAARATVSGADQAPAGSACSRPLQPVAGLRLPPPDSLSGLMLHCEPPRCLRGEPPVWIDSSLSLPDLISFGENDFAFFRQRADYTVHQRALTVAPVVAGATCVTAVTHNWGDPYTTLGVCGEHVPVVFATGDLRVTGGRGQGLLVVDGDLSLERGVHFAGLIVVRGALSLTGQGTRVEGAVVVANVALEQSTVGSGAKVQYSSCAVHRALVAAGTLQPLAERRWFQRY